MVICMSISKTSLFDKAVESVGNCVVGASNYISNSSKYTTKEERELFVTYTLICNRTAFIFGNESFLNEFRSIGLPAKLYTVDSFLNEGLRECFCHGFKDVYLHTSVDAEFIKAMKLEFKNNVDDYYEEYIEYIGKLRGKSGRDMFNYLWEDIAFRYVAK